MSSTSTTWITDTNTKSGTVQVYESNVSTLKITGVESGDAVLELFADQGDDNADKWRMWTASSDNDLHFSNYTSGAWADKLTIQDGGNVGIGTNSPQYTLDVDKGTGGNIAIFRGANSTGLLIAENSYVASIEHTSTNRDLNFVTSGTGDFYFSNSGSGGNVGIGTTDPHENLDIYNDSSTNANCTLRVINDYNGADSEIKLQAKTDAGGAHYAVLKLDGTTEDFVIDMEDTSGAFTILQNGNVGIGATAPISPLEVWGASGGHTFLNIWCQNSASGDPVIRFGGRADQAASAVTDFDWGIGLDRGANKLAFLYDASNGVTEAASDQLMVIDSSGKVGIGTASPTVGSKLHVKSEESMTAGVGQVIIENTQGCTDNDTMLQLDWSADADIHTGITAKFISFHDSGGEIGYITTANDGAVNAITASDVRLKKNIRNTAINGLSIINSVKIRDFEWNNKKGKHFEGKTVQAQYVADELYDVYPLATSGTPGKMKDILDDDGNKVGEDIDAMGVSDGRLISVLVKAVQELSAKVIALESK